MAQYRASSKQGAILVLANTTDFGVMPVLNQYRCQCWHGTDVPFRSHVGSRPCLCQHYASTRNPSAVLARYQASFEFPPGNMPTFGKVLTGSIGITPRLQLAQYCARCKNCLGSDFSTWDVTDLQFLKNFNLFKLPSGIAYNNAIKIVIAKGFHINRIGKEKIPFG